MSVTASSVTGSPTIQSIFDFTDASGNTYFKNGAVATAGTTVASGDRISVSAIANSTNMNVRLGCGAWFANRTNESVTLTQFHWHPGSAPVAYYENTGTSPRYDSARFDHDPDTRAPRGLLVEATVTNPLCWSESFATSGGTTNWALNGNSGATVTETNPAGHGFLADVVVAWEAAANPARDAGIRVVHPRTGLVVAGNGGAWGRMFPLFKAGVGGKLGSGKQYWSWISLRDEVGALTYLMENESLTGPVNLTAPTPQTNAEITKVMGSVLGRPTLLAVPSIALKTVLGEFSSKVLGSARVLPAVLEQKGFHFQDTTIESAIRQALV
jgi:hypothetical protein